MPLLLLLVVFFLVPWLGLALLISVGLLLLVLVPLGVAGGALFSIMAKPSNLTSIFCDGRVKRVHGLQHATCNVLSSSGYVCSPGEVDRRGFSVEGFDDPSSVMDAAKEALELLRSGRRDLVVYPRCGATMLGVNLMLSCIFIAFMALSGYLGLLSVVVALVMAHLLGPVLSPWVQRWLTTDWNMGPLSISGVESRSGIKRIGGFSVMMSRMIYVSVNDDTGVIEAEVV